MLFDVIIIVIGLIGIGFYFGYSANLYKKNKIEQIHFNPVKFLKDFYLDVSTRYNMFASIMFTIFLSPLIIIFYVFCLLRFLFVFLFVKKDKVGKYEK